MDGVLVREVVIDAPADVVFGFFTDPAKMTRWKGSRAELEPRPGGLYSVDVTPEALARGSYVELVPNERVVFTWGWEGSPIAPGSTTVEITLRPEGDKTVVRLEHRGLPPEAVAEHEKGWDHYLPRLAVAAAGGDPGPDEHPEG